MAKKNNTQEPVTFSASATKEGITSKDPEETTVGTDERDETVGEKSLGENPANDIRSSRRIADEKRNFQRKQEAKKLKELLIKDLSEIQIKQPPFGFVIREGDLLIYISYPANVIAKISLPNQLRMKAMVVVYDQMFRRLIYENGSSFIRDFVQNNVV